MVLKLLKKNFTFKTRMYMYMYILYIYTSYYE